MSEQPLSEERSHWLESSGIRHLLSMPRTALRLEPLAVGTAGVVATVLLGLVLNGLSRLGGGVAIDAVERFVAARQFDQDYAEPEGPHGALGVFWRHEKSCVYGLLGSLVPGRGLTTGTALGDQFRAQSQSRPAAYLGGVLYGVLWLVGHHPFTALVFAAGCLVIWSLAGGAICRIAAMQTARDELVTASDAFHFASRKLFDGFVLAPLVPLGLVAIICLLLMLGGFLLRIPWLGDLVGGAAFMLALGGGAVVTALLLGMLAGGHLFWPAVACDGADGFDAFSRSFCYLFGRPWRALFYGAIALIYTGVIWLAANFLVYAGLRITQVVVGFGTSPFGLWPQQVQGEAVSKLSVIWPAVSPTNLYRAPQWEYLGFFEHVSAALIACWVLLVLAAMWSLLTTCYFSSATIAYLLLRRDVDGVDVADVQSDYDETMPLTSSRKRGLPLEEKDAGAAAGVASEPSAPASPVPDAAHTPLSRPEQQESSAAHCETPGDAHPSESAPGDDGGAAESRPPTSPS